MEAKAVSNDISKKEKQQKDEFKMAQIRQIIFYNMKETRTILTDTYALLKNRYDAEGFSLRPDNLEELKILCLTTGYNDSELAKVILAVAIFDTESCIKWLKTLAQALDIGQKENPKFIKKIKEASSYWGDGDYTPGFILGVIATADYLFQTQPDMSKFEDYLAELLKDLIIVKSDLKARTDRRFTYNYGDISQDGKAFSGQLANVLAAFFKKENREDWERRKKLLELTLQKVQAHRLKNPDFEYPRGIAKMLLSQLLYLDFKQTDLLDQLEILGSYYLAQAQK